MSYDEGLADRVRAALGARKDVVERKMFGGLCFMVAGSMCCGVSKTDLVVKIPKEDNDALLALPHVRPFDFTGRPMAGIVYVAAAGTKTPKQLAAWVRRGLDRIEREPAKAKAKPKPKPTAQKLTARGSPRALRRRTGRS